MPFACIKDKHNILSIFYVIKYYIAVILFDTHRHIIDKNKDEFGNI